MAEGIGFKPIEAQEPDSDALGGDVLEGSRHAVLRSIKNRIRERPQREHQVDGESSRSILDIFLDNDDDEEKKKSRRRAGRLRRMLSLVFVPTPIQTEQQTTERHHHDQSDVTHEKHVIETLPVDQEQTTTTDVDTHPSERTHNTTIQAVDVAPTTDKAQDDDSEQDKNSRNQPRIVTDTTFTHEQVVSRQPELLRRYPRTYAIEQEPSTSIWDQSSLGFQEVGARRNTAKQSLPAAAKEQQFDSQINAVAGNVVDSTTTSMPEKQKFRAQLKPESSSTPEAKAGPRVIEKANEAKEHRTDEHKETLLKEAVIQDAKNQLRHTEKLLTQQADKLRQQQKITEALVADVAELETKDPKELTYELSHEHKDFDSQQSSFWSVTGKSSIKNAQKDAILRAGAFGLAAAAKQAQINQTNSNVDDSHGLYQRAAVSGFVTAILIIAVILVILLLQSR